MKKRIIKEIENHLYNYKKETPEWKEIIDNNIKEIYEIDQKIIDLRYFKNKKINYITYELYISRCKYFKAIDNFITNVAIDAAYKRLFKP